jgi:transcription initiation factor IIE alpha subunit
MIKCPYCKQEFDEEEIKNKEIGAYQIFFSCPRCNTILEIAYQPKK